MSYHPLRQFRENQDPKLSQEQLAQLIKVTKATVSRWENGERFPERELWPVIKDVTGIGAEEFAEWKAPSKTEAA